MEPISEIFILDVISFFILVKRFKVLIFSRDSFITCTHFSMGVPTSPSWGSCKVVGEGGGGKFHGTGV